MKAVVLEIKNGYAAVLKEDGTVIKIRRECEVGETIILSGKEENPGKPMRFTRTARIIIRVAAVLLAAFIGCGAYYLTATAATKVEVTGAEATITLSLNHFNRVIAVAAVGDDADELQSLLEQEGVRNNTFPEALEKTTRLLQAREEAGSGTCETGSAVPVTGLAAVSFGAGAA